MGFRPEPTTIKLNFRDADLEGLEVLMKSMPVGEYNKMIANALLTGQEGLDEAERTFDKFCDCLISWNMEDPVTGDPLPPTREGVEKIDSNLFSRLIAAWQQGLVAVPTKPQPQSNGGALPNRSAESGLGLGSLSQSP